MLSPPLIITGQIRVPCLTNPRKSSTLLKTTDTNKITSIFRISITLITIPLRQLQPGKHLPNMQAKVGKDANKCTQNLKSYETYYIVKKCK